MKLDLEYLFILTPQMSIPHQHGKVHLYDVRFPDTWLMQYSLTYVVRACATYVCYTAP